MDGVLTVRSVKNVRYIKEIVKELIKSNEPILSSEIFKKSLLHCDHRTFRRGIIKLQNMGLIDTLNQFLGYTYGRRKFITYLDKNSLILFLNDKKQRKEESAN